MRHVPGSAAPGRSRLPRATCTAGDAERADADVTTDRSHAPHRRGRARSRARTGLAVRAVSACQCSPRLPDARGDGYAPGGWVEWNAARAAGISESPSRPAGAADPQLTGRRPGPSTDVRDDVDLAPSADVADRHDAGVAQPCEPAGLLEEPLRLGLRDLGATTEDPEATADGAACRGQGTPPPKPPAPNAFRTQRAKGGGVGRSIPLVRRLASGSGTVYGQIRLAPRLGLADGRAGKGGIRSMATSPEGSSG